MLNASRPFLLGSGFPCVSRAYPVRSAGSLLARAFPCGRDLARGREHRNAAARAMGVDVLPKWNALRATGIAAFNAKRKSAGLPTLTLP